LLIVDNSGNEDLDSVAALIPDTRIVETPRALGFAEANNYGLVHGGMEGAAVCFLNQDTLCGLGWLDACMDVIDRDCRTGAVSPLLTTLDGADWDEGFAYCVRELPELSGVRPFDTPRGMFEAPLLTAAALVIRTDVLRRIGPFDPVFGSYYEDFDLCRRVHEAGCRLAVCADGVVRHYGGSATTSPAAEHKRKRQLVRNRLIHRIRCAGPGRWKRLCRYLAIEFPYGLGRCLARTSSAPPLSAFLQAHRDLVPLLNRLISESRDRQEFEAYLTQMHWDDCAECVQALSA
jgi:GT2 family glycosyltransferase